MSQDRSNTQKLTPLTAYLKKDEAQILQKLAREDKRPVSNYLKKLIEKHISEQANAKNQKPSGTTGKTARAFLTPLEALG